MGSNNGSNFPGLALGLSFNSDQQNIQCIPIIKEKQEKGKTGLVLKFDHVLPCLSLGSIPGRSHGLIGDPAGSSISPGSSDSNSSSMKRVKDIRDGILDVDKTVMSRGSDDDEDGCTRKKLRLNKEQSAVLEDSFKEHSTLNPTQKEALARQLKLRTRQVEVWFQNRRARTKLKQTEMDCELLKKCCQNLTDENKRLQMELQELRALNLPVLMQMPVATLTICPSCERLNSASGGEGGCLGGGGGKSQLKGPLNNPFARSSTC